MNEVVVALDIGGTKVIGATIDAQGTVLRRDRQPVAVAHGADAFFSQIIQMIGNLADGFPVSQVGIGCAGPLDGTAGELLDPTNFFTEGKTWGRLDFLSPLRAAFPKWRFQLENDAAAAVLGEAWLGGGEKENLLVLTLGTGVGVGALVGGQLVRSREGLHPEASHIPLNFADTNVPCGCGNFGCIEAYLSGQHTIERLAKSWREPKLSGAELVTRAHAGEAKVLQALALYGEWLAQAVQAFAVLYGPRQVRLSGGFAAAAPWFLPTVKSRLPELLKRRRVGKDLLPEVAVSRLGEDLGLFGAACVARQAQ